MQQFTIAFLGVLLFCSPSVMFAQKIVPFIKKIPSQEDRLLGFNRTTSIVSIQETEAGIFVLTQRHGSYLITQENTGNELKSLIRPKDRRDYFLDFFKHNNEVLLWANANEIVSLTSVENERISFTSSFFSETVQSSSIAMDQRGTIYIGTSQDGLFVFEKDEWGHYSNIPKRLSAFDQQLPSNNIRCLYKDTNEVIWIGTDAGLASIVNGELKNLSVKEKLPQKWWQKLLGIRSERPVFTEPINAIVSLRNSLVLATEEELYKVSVVNDTLKYMHQYFFADRIGTPLTNVKDLLVDIDGNLWIAGDQLIQFNITTDKVNVVSDNYKFIGSGFTSLAEDIKEEKIWVGTQRGGLYKVDFPDPNTGIGY